MGLEETAAYVLTDLAMDDDLRAKLTRRIIAAIRAAINDKLEEVAHELDKLAEGHYTTAQTPAGLVRAMKVE